MNLITVTDLNMPELLPYSTVSENNLLHYYEPDPGLFVAESPNVIMRALQGGYDPVSFLVEKQQLTEPVLEMMQAYPDLPVYIVDHDILQKITGYPMTRGLLGLFRRKEMPSVSEMLKNTTRIAVLEDVMNPTNVGAIFRSAAALGVDCVLLTKGCSDPLYRRASRVSMGTVFQVPWTWLPKDNWMDVIKQEGYRTAAMALKNDSYSLEDPKLLEPQKLAVILGTEGTGLKDETLDACDMTVKIPMTHNVDSLNVAAASAVAFWQLCMKNKLN